MWVVSSYSKQKNAQYAHFRVNAQDLDKVKGGQFTLYNFLSNSFAFSPERKALAVDVLDALKEQPHSFAALQKKLKARKSSLYLALLSLERSGLIEKPEGRGGAYALSHRFAEALSAYASWWREWRRDALKE